MLAYIRPDNGSRCKTKTVDFETERIRATKLQNPSQARGHAKNTLHLLRHAISRVASNYAQL